MGGSGFSNDVFLLDTRTHTGSQVIKELEFKIFCTSTSAITVMGKTGKVIALVSGMPANSQNRSDRKLLVTYNRYGNKIDIKDVKK